MAKQINVYITCSRRTSIDACISCGKIQWESWMTFSLKLSIWKDILPTWDLDWYNMFNRQKILTEQDSRQPAGVICHCMWTWDGMKNKMQLIDNRHFLRLTLKNCGILIKKPIDFIQSWDSGYITHGYSFIYSVNQFSYHWHLPTHVHCVFLWFIHSCDAL